MSASASNLPRRLGRYDVVGALETQASGAVVLISGRLHHDGHGGQEPPVAIRRVAPELARGKDAAGFLDTVRKAEAVRHANLAEIRELGNQDGELFVVMEHLDGQSAASILQRLRATGETLDFDLAAHVIAEACAAIEAAHEAGILHEHLTPHDLFVGYDGSVKVLDLGIASAIVKLSEGTAIPPRELPYACAERCKGDAADRQSDVFSLGAILWELMSGVSPFERGSEAATIRAIMSEDPEMPPPAVLGGMPMQFSEIATTALASDRSKRYPTAAKLRQELLGFLASRTPAHPPASMLAELMQRLFKQASPELSEEVRRAEAPTAPPPVAPESQRDIETARVLVPVLPARPPSDAGEASPPSSASSPPSSALAAGTGQEGEELEVEPSRVDLPAARVPKRLAAAVIGLVVAIGAFGLASFLRTPSASSGPAPKKSIVVEHSGPTPSTEPSLQFGAAVTSSVGVDDTAPHAPTTATSDQATVRIETIPSKASVFVNGTSKGVTPLDLKLPKGATPVDVELRHGGYQTLKERVVPDVDQKLRLTLVATAPTPRAPAPSASAGPYYRFE
jgi:serine/threonine-protein kinase